MIAGLLALSVFVTDTLRPRTDSTVSAATLPVVVAAADTVVPGVPVAPAPTADPVAYGPRVAHLPVGPLLLLSDADTVRKRRPLVQYSDWYGRRLAIHRTLSWAMLPLFGVSYYTGDQLLSKGRGGVSGWVRDTHPLAAGATAGVFGVNTVTGLWNLWDARKDPEGRTRRIIHSVLFLAADAGFAYAGSIGEEAGEDGDVRKRHRTIALGSMGLSTASWVYMLLTK